MNRLSNSQIDPQELLERGRLTLQAIQYHERAARYKAAAATLQAAMIQAENGNAAKLQEWLESESPPFDVESTSSSSPQDKAEDAGIHPPMLSLRLDSKEPKPHPHLRSQQSTDRDSEKEKLDLDRMATPNPSEKSVETNPWANMEKGAMERLAEAGTTELSSETKDLFAVGIDNQELFDSKVDTPEWSSEPKENAPLQTELPTEFTVALDDLGTDSGEPRVKAWWKAPHVWVSVVAHAFLAVGLSLIVAKVAAEPKLLAVVSAPVEADNVLLETPMEIISELETTAEPMESMPAPSLAGLASDVASDITLDKSALQAGTMPSATPSMSAALNGASSEMSHGSMAGSKMLSGAEFFGVKATGNTFIYIVDSSPSMRRDGAFDAAKTEIMRSLQSMKPKQRYFISFFGKEIDPMVFQTGVIEKYPVYAKPENLTKTIEWLNRVVIQKEGLPPNNALTEAITMQPDGIFLLFDGDTKVDVAKHLRKVNRSDDVLSSGLPKVPIHVVHFFQDEFQKQMKQVAEENGGTYRFVPRPQRPSKK